MATEVEETLKRLGSHNSVKGTIVVNFDGIPIKSTMDPHTTTQYSGTVFRFCNLFIKNVIIKVTEKYCKDKKYVIVRSPFLRKNLQAWKCV